MIRRVEDAEGNVLYNDLGKSHRAVTEATAFLMSSMLADVVNSGTGYRARQAGFVLPAAGKTGTTNDYVDAWFVGFTPHIVTGVWIGFDQPSPIVAGGYAGELAVPVWTGFMKTATKGDKPDWFERPANVVGINVCRVSGKLPNEGCGSVEVMASDGSTQTRSLIYADYFVKGTQPTTICPLHSSVSFLDRLAGVFGGGDDNKPAPLSADDAGLGRISGGVIAPPPPKDVRSDDAVAKDTDVEEDEPPKKKGFWGKIFGKGDDRKEEKKDDKKGETKKKPGGGG